MALPNPKDRRPAPKRPGRTAKGHDTPPAPPRAERAPEATSARPAERAPERAPEPAPISARARRKQAEEAARQRAVTRPRGTPSSPQDDADADAAAHKAEKRAERQTRKAAARDDHKAKRAEQNARRAVRLRRIIQWVFPDHTRRVARGKAIAILVLNIFPFPGLGTALYGHWERGLMQFLLTFLFLIGWVWAVFDGIRIVSAAYRPPPALRQATSRPTR